MNKLSLPVRFVTISRIFISFYLIGLGVVCYALVFSEKASSQTQNQPPVAVDQTFSGLAARGQEGPALLAGASDPEGDPLHTFGGQLNFQHGTGGYDIEGGFTYTPSGIVEADSAPFGVCDNQGNCTQATLTLTNANSAPEASSAYYRVSKFDVDGNYLIQPSKGLKNYSFDPDGDEFYTGGPVDPETPYGFLTV